jgi:hypothetical protein
MESRYKLDNYCLTARQFFGSDYRRTVRAMELSNDNASRRNQN